jgi:hypothetical protein
MIVEWVVGCWSASTLEPLETLSVLEIVLSAWWGHGRGNGPALMVTQADARWALLGASASYHPGYPLLDLAPPLGGETRDEGRRQQARTKKKVLLPFWCGREFN